jgi:hypothetical protein
MWAVFYLTPPKGLASCIGKGIATERRGIFTCQCRCLKEERPKSNTEQILISAHAQGCELQANTAAKYHSTGQHRTCLPSSAPGQPGGEGCSESSFQSLIHESKWDSGLKHSCAVGWTRRTSYVTLFHNCEGTDKGKLGEIRMLRLLIVQLDGRSHLIWRYTARATNQGRDLIRRLA